MKTAPTIPVQIWVGLFKTAEHFDAYVYGSSLSYDPESVYDAPDLVIEETEDSSMSRFSSDNNSTCVNIEMLSMAFEPKKTSDPQELLTQLPIDTSTIQDAMENWNRLHESLIINAAVALFAEVFPDPATNISTSYSMYFLGTLNP